MDLKRIKGRLQFGHVGISVYIASCKVINLVGMIDLKWVLGWEPLV